MGVQGLWELLAPVGRRVSVETLAGKKLAIDASIWMVQFIKAMRDDRGEMVRNAHILGFFRRICKLLFLRTKPVFVFDGATPALKRRTLIARRRQRDNAQAKVRKTAEKLLLNHLKAMKLKELAEDLRNQRGQGVPKKKVLSNDNRTVYSASEMDKGDTNRGSLGNLDEMFAASIMAEESGIVTSKASSFAGASFTKENGSEGIILPPTQDVDRDLSSTSPSSVQDEVQKQKYKNDSMGKKILSDGIPPVVGSDRDGTEVVSRSDYQQNFDEMLAASLMAEEAGTMNDNASVSAATDLDGDVLDDEDEEMLLPEMNGVVDPSVLAALPPSVQLDLLVQMRERLMAENRQKYQRVKKDPVKFSELQLQAYLKTVAFRRDIDQVQKAAAGRGVGGVQTSRIASEANREFIFSSSFKGDIEVLASKGAERNRDKEQQQELRSQQPSSCPDNTEVGPSVIRGQQPLSCLNNTEVPSTSTGIAQTTPDKSTGVFDDNIETFLDERGRVRVSWVRAMGMHMTRDLERNLELMKEFEKNTNVNKVSGTESVQSIDICDPKSFSSKSQVVDTPCEGVSEPIRLEERSGGGSLLNEDTSIEILFEDDGVKSFDGDDDIFTHLATENPLQMASFDLSSQKLSADGNMESDWEEGDEGKACKLQNDVDCDPSSNEARVSDESEVEWEEGVCDHVNTIPHATGSGRSVSRGCLEEEADLQEAIRRSLEGMGDTKSDADLSEPGKRATDIEIAEQYTAVQNEDAIRLEEPISVGEMNCSEANDVAGRQEITENTSQEIECLESALLLDTKIHAIAEQLDASCKNTAFGGEESKEMIDSVETLSREIPSAIQVGWRENNTVIEPPNHMVQREGISTHVDSLPEENASETLLKQDFSTDKDSSNLLLDDNDARKPVIEESINVEFEVTETEVLNRISFLEQERQNLESEQKRLERNAESASSEMFAECQELLQMFGLPYIIAPMEAEAQCASMELANLVDGVVTDDSDVFLFGARSVYKNIFDDRKYVETYYMKDIENELGLDRDKLIRMALLLGSDYTEGISGIGIVNAIEVVHAFPEEDGLHKFKDWIESPDPSILGILDKQEDISASGKNSSGALKRKKSASAIDVKQSFMDKHRNVSKNWHIPSTFPSEAVISAYFCPQVDNSAEPFTWGKPDHFLLRRLCWEKFGWENRKADELLLPVLKEYSKHETQLRLEAFYTFNERFAKIRSKRIKKALRGINGSQSAVLMEDVEEDISVNKQKELSVGRGENMSEKASSAIEGACSNEVDKGNRFRKPKEGENRSRNKRSQKNSRERGREKAKATSITELVETSSSDEGDEYDERKIMKEPQERRRSTRVRKPASYIMDDEDQPSNHIEERLSDEGAIKQDVASHSDDIERDLPAPQKTPQENQLEMEDDIYSVDEEMRQQGMWVDRDPSSEATVVRIGENYLETGGGFCLDESNEGGDMDAYHNPATVSEGLKEGSDDGVGQSSLSLEESFGTFQNVGADAPLLDVDRPNSTRTRKSFRVDLDEDDWQEEGTDHTATVGALRSMRNLRKRRKY